MKTLFFGLLFGSLSAFAQTPEVVAIENLSKTVALPYLGGSVEEANKRIQNTLVQVEASGSTVVFEVKYRSWRDTNSGCDRIDCEGNYVETQCEGTVTVKSSIVKQNSPLANIVCR
jgi:hypothetical protein